MRLIILDSAVKHGYTQRDVTHAWNDYLRYFKEGEDPDKVIRIGFDTHMRLLEIGANVYPDGTVKIFHAMKARPKYTHYL